MKLRRAVISLLAVCAFILGAKANAAQEIKFAIVAPEGSTWSKVVNDWNQELKTKTKGEVSLKIYSGGVQGDEGDVIRKLKIGQLDGAGFTGKGLGAINPEVRVLELPFLFDSYKEADAVTKKIQPRLEAGFEKKGFALLGWAEAGFVNIFSNKPISKVTDLKGSKMWMWEADPLAKALCDAFGIVPIPLALTDVLTSLQTKLIDAAYAPPLAAIAMQWFTRTKYYTTDKLADSTGAFLITKKTLDSLSPANQQILKETAKKYSRMLTDRTRSENENSYAALKKSGLTPVDIDKAELESIKKTSEKVWDTLVGTLYPADLLAQVKAELASVRGK